MSNGSAYTTERRTAWAYAERMSPHDRDAQETHFQKKFAELVEKTNKSRLRKKTGEVRPRNLPVSYDISRPHKVCSGFEHLQHLV